MGPARAPIFARFRDTRVRYRNNGCGVARPNAGERGACAARAALTASSVSLLPRRRRSLLVQVFFRRGSLGGKTIRPPGGWRIGSDPGRGRPTNFAVRCARQRLAATPYPLFLQRTLVSRKRAKIGARAGPIWHYAALRGTTWHKSAPYMYAYMRVRRTSGIATSCHPAQLPREDRARPPGRRATVAARGR